MAYKYEKNKNGEYDLVIDGFENGIADSPYQGIGNLRNVNITYYGGVTYVNYKRKPATITGGTMGTPRYATQSPQGIIYISDNNGNIFKQSTLDSSIFAALTGGPSGTGGAGLQWWNNYLISFRSGSIDMCGDGSGDGGITSGNWNRSGSGLPITTGLFNMTTTPGTGSTSATLSVAWAQPSGTYAIDMGGIGGQIVYANFTNSSTAMSWAPALNASAGSSQFFSRPVNNGAGAGNGFHQSLVSINDGNLYFCNGSDVGVLQLLPFQTFNNLIINGNNWYFNSAALSLPPTETLTWLVELRNQLLILAPYKMYPWDRFSPQWLNPIPIQEQMYKAINILNNIYIFAGNKGNIYLSNGSVISPFKKMPDYIAGTIDPVWTWGDIMSFRQRLWFQAYVQNGQTGTGILAGIFSMGLTNAGSAISVETPGSLVMEAQNSFGLVSGTTTAPGLLINNLPTALNYQNYYSAWSNGSSPFGGIDYNDTTLWSSNEPFIETDLINIASIAQPKTFSNMEFKLDQPLQSGDSITVYARQSLSDSYTLIGTTTTNVLSDFYEPWPVEQWQWIQFKVTMSCNPTATSSSFNRLKEIRIR